MLKNKGQLIQFPKLRLGQTWVAKSGYHYEGDRCRIIYLKGDVVGVEIDSGKKFNTSRQYILDNFVLNLEEIECNAN